MTTLICSCDLDGDEGGGGCGSAGGGKSRKDRTTTTTTSTATRRHRNRQSVLFFLSIVVTGSVLSLISSIVSSSSSISSSFSMSWSYYTASSHRKTGGVVDDTELGNNRTKNSNKTNGYNLHGTGTKAAKPGGTTIEMTQPPPRANSTRTLPKMILPVGKNRTNTFQSNRLRPLPPHLTANILPLPAIIADETTTNSVETNASVVGTDGECIDDVVTRIYGDQNQNTQNDDDRTTATRVNGAMVTWTKNHHDPKPPKFMLFITTHFSNEHIRFFDCCWVQLMTQSTLLQHAHVLIAATNSTPVRAFDDDFNYSTVNNNKINNNMNSRSQLRSPSSFMYHLRHVVFGRNPSFEIKWVDPKQYPRQQQQQRNNINKAAKANVKQWGANLGLLVAFKHGWFFSSSAYEWIVRVNPDVLIRNTTTLQRYFHDPNVDAILHKCRQPSCEFPYLQLHTDILVFRPDATLLWQQQQQRQQQEHEDKTHVNPTDVVDIPFSQMESGIGDLDNDVYTLNHELTASKYFHSIVRAGRHVWWDGLPPSFGLCRVGAGERGGMVSPVIHDHSVINQCRIGYNHSSPIQRICTALDGVPWLPRS